MKHVSPDQPVQELINLRHRLQRQRARQQTILRSNGRSLQKLQTKLLIAALGQDLRGRVNNGLYWLELLRSAWKHWMLKRRRFDRIFSIEDQFSEFHICETEFCRVFEVAISVFPLQVGKNPFAIPYSTMLFPTIFAGLISARFVLGSTTTTNPVL